MRPLERLHYQTTLRDTIELEGVGLHTGLAARVRLRPAPAGSGFAFRVEDGVTIPARAEYVVDTRRATVLGAEGRTVSTVEHLLSALFGMGVDNALIEVDGGEVPVLDGSARPFAEAIAAVGTTSLREPQRRYVPASPAFFRDDDDKVLIVIPAAEFRVKVAIDFPAPIGAQYFQSAITPELYAREIAAHRTFGFAHEVEALRRNGLARGGTLENAVVFGADGPLQTLRAPNEPARHKALDLVGDFALLGAWPQCELVAIKSGHALHSRAVAELRRATPLEPAAAR